ncbi:MAG: DNA repair protein RecO [Candidatus Binatia bacterium]
MTPAIVLRSRPFGESDKIVSFFTQDYGKVTGIAKGAKRSRKRFVNSLEPFSLVNLYFYNSLHGSLAFVHACNLVQAFNDLSTSLEKVAHASYIVEITEALSSEREENRLIFEHLKQALSLVEAEGPSLPFLTYFELKLLKLAGYEPMLEHCRRCAKNWRVESQVEWCFSPRDGGILCGSCSAFRKATMPLSLAAVDALSNLQKANPVFSHHAAPTPSVLKEGQAVLLRFIQFQVDKELKSARFIDTFSLA